MKTWNDVTHFAGFDWAKDHHDVLVLDGSGKIVTEFRFDHTASGWTLCQEKLAQFPQVAIAVEAGHSAAIERLVALNHRVYPVHPRSSKSYRTRRAPSGTKTDRDYATMTRRLLEEIGYIDYLRRTCKTAEEANKREEGLAEFLDSISEHRARTGRSEKGLQHFLDEVMLSSDREDEDDLEKKSGVCLITMHAAKGLEFPHVYLVGLEEGILPHSRSLEEGSRDEERRLLYVGITRARERLTISYCTSRVRYGEPSPCQPSSFIKEMDKSFVEEICFEDLANEPASDEAAANYFEQLKAMLASG